MKSLRGYEEGLYYMGLTCRRLKEGLALGLDPDLFEEHFLDEVDYIDSVFDRLQQSLLEEQHLIQRKEYSHQLILSRQIFHNLLNDMLRLSKEGLSFSQQGELIISLQNKNQSKIDEVIASFNLDKSEVSPEEVITHEEMNILLGETKSNH